MDFDQGLITAGNTVHLLVLDGWQRHAGMRNPFHEAIRRVCLMPVWFAELTTSIDLNGADSALSSVIYVIRITPVDFQDPLEFSTMEIRAS